MKKTRPQDFLYRRILSPFIAKLKAFNEQYDKYEVIGSGVYEGYVNQLSLNSSLLDKDLKKKYEEEIGDCWVQVIVSKKL